MRLYCAGIITGSDPLVEIEIMYFRQHVVSYSFFLLSLFSFNKLVILGVILDLCSGDRFFHRFFPSGLLAVLLFFSINRLPHIFVYFSSFYFLKAVELVG